MKKIITILCIAISWTTYGQIQQDVNKTSGTVSTPINDIDSIRFNSGTGVMEVVLNNGNAESHAISDVDNVTFGPTAPPTGLTCGDDITDARDGKTYGTVEIGSQCWMSENLNHTPSSGNSWCYDNDAAKCNIYGRLYDWSMAMNNASSSNGNPRGIQGVCPTGWHLPRDTEWKELEMYLGVSQTDADNTGWRGTNEGDQLKASSWRGTNSSGFTALPGGFRGTSGSFDDEGSYGYWWSATESGSAAWFRVLSSSQSAVYRITFAKGTGYSVRCVRN